MKIANRSVRFFPAGLAVLLFCCSGQNADAQTAEELLQLEQEVLLAEEYPQSEAGTGMQEQPEYGGQEYYSGYTAYCSEAPAELQDCAMYCARLKNVPYVWLPFVDKDHPACPAGMRCDDPADPAQPGQKLDCNYNIWNQGLVLYRSSCI